jgi:hypothetical protein
MALRMDMSSEIDMREILNQKFSTEFLIEDALIAAKRFIR